MNRRSLLCVNFLLSIITTPHHPHPQSYTRSLCFMTPHPLCYSYAQITKTIKRAIVNYHFTRDKKNVIARGGQV